MHSPSILILKTGALGDVLRTTSILFGLRKRSPEARIEWVTARSAEDLVRGHPQLAGVHLVDPGDGEELRELGIRLARTRWNWVISLDDEVSLCRLAAGLETEQLSGAYLDEGGERRYTEDVAPWFDMGLLSVHGKSAADRLKIQNTRSHAAIYADMLGLELGRPELALDAQTLERAARWRAGLERSVESALIGLNTGAGGRWTSKQLPLERVVEYAVEMTRAAGRAVHFIVLGGPEEAERNQRLCAALEERAQEDAPVAFSDGGVDWSLTEFGALVDGLDLLLTSDSLALHLAVARETPLVAFFAPTSAAEIELFGLGEKVASTAPDYCSYRADADTSSLTAERLVAASLRVLGD